MFKNTFSSVVCDSYTRFFVQILYDKLFTVRKYIAYFADINFFVCEKEKASSVSVQ